MTSILKSYITNNKCPLCRKNFTLSDIKLNFGNFKNNYSPIKQIEIKSGLLAYPGKSISSSLDTYYKKIIKNFNSFVVETVNLTDIFGNNYSVKSLNPSNISNKKEISIFYYGNTKTSFYNILKKLSVYYHNSKIILYELIEQTQLKKSKSDLN